jgi:type III secretion system (T3SS) SseB-like protein
MESGKERLMSTPLEPFQAENALETAILAMQAGTFPVPRLLEAIMNTEIYVSSRTEMEPSGSGFQPLLIGDKEKPLVCAFSSPSRPALHAKAAPYMLRINGRQFIQQLPAGYGIAFNPGFIAQLAIQPDMVAAIQKELAAAAAPKPPNQGA